MIYHADITYGSKANLINMEGLGQTGKARHQPILACKLYIMWLKSYWSKRQAEERHLGVEGDKRTPLSDEVIKEGIKRIL